MSAAALIAEAAAAGVTLVRIGDDRLKWTCAGPPPPSLLERLKANKTAVLAALRAGERFGPDSALERDPTRAPADAERAALLDCAAQWRCENPLDANGPDDPCAHCGERMTMESATPVLAGPGQHAWLHRMCWKPMIEARQQQALDAVRVLFGEPPC